MAVGMTGVIDERDRPVDRLHLRPFGGGGCGKALAPLRAAGRRRAWGRDLGSVEVPASAVSAACGAVNGIGTVGLGVHPFIVTLGVAVTAGWRSSFRRVIGGLLIIPRRHRCSGSAVPTLVMVAVGLAAFVMRRMVLGRQTRKRNAGRYAGIAVGRVKITVFATPGHCGVERGGCVGYLGGASSDTGRATSWTSSRGGRRRGRALQGNRSGACSVRRHRADQRLTGRSPIRRGPELLADRDRPDRAGGGGGSGQTPVERGFGGPTR